MAGSPRLASLRLWIFAFACFSAHLSHAHPTTADGTSDIVAQTAAGTQVFDPSTDASVPQGLASDGAGIDFDLTAILWIILAFVAGVPLATGGVRGGRFTSGAGAGLVLAVGIWASLINTVNATGVPDIAVLLITCLLFAVGFVVGFITTEYGIGAGALAAAGGVSVGIRVILLKDGLLVPVFFVNWLLSALGGLIGLAIVIWRERIGVIVGSASAGSFLVVLALDLLINKQSGMSRGLRFLFDRNSNHLVDILGNGYHPTISTQALLGASLAAIPILVFIQYKLFPGPFRSGNRRASSVLADDASIAEQGWFSRRLGGLKWRSSRESLRRPDSGKSAKGGQREVEISAPVILTYPTVAPKSRFSL